MTADDDIRREIEAHLEEEIEERRVEGASAADARTEALRALGNPVRIREDVHDLSPWAWAEHVAQDVRFALRVFRRSPLFALTAVASLALGIGANAAIFGVIDAAVLRPLPVMRPNELVVLGRTFDPTGWFSYDATRFAYPDYRLLRDASRSVDLMAASSIRPASIDHGDVTEPAFAKVVSTNYFSGLGVAPALGRIFSADDERAPVVILGHHYWTRRFASEPDVLGRMIQLDGVPFTIVGVAREDFSGESPGERPDVYTSTALMTPQQLEERGFTWLTLLGRLREDATAQQAAAELSAAFASVPRPDAVERGRPPIALESGARGLSRFRDRFADPLQVLMAGVTLVLLMTCANLATLLLSRGAARRHEIATRLAIGARPARIIRQLLTESLLLAAAGGAAGLLVGVWGARFLVGLVAAGQPGVSLDIGPDARLLAFTAAVSALAGVLFGLAPAVRLVRSHGVVLGAGEGRIVGAAVHAWMRRSLIAVQTALAVVLLAAGLLFGRTLWNLGSQDLGLSLDAQVLQVTLVRERGYRPEAAVVLPRLLQRLEVIPGVVSATAVAGGTLSSGENGVYGLEFPGYTPRDPEDGRSRADWVGPNYFRTVGIPLVSGRDLSLADSGDAPRVVIVNEAFARHYFGTATAAGRTFTWSDRSYEIVGIAKDAKYGDLRGVAEPRIYFSLLQVGPPGRLEIRTAGIDPGTITAAVRAAVREVDPRQSVGEVTTLAERLDRALARERLLADLSTFFGGLTVLLVAIGVYGTVAFSAATRLREIGLRLALGASRRAVMWSMLREWSAPIAIGLAFGVAGAVAAGRVVASLLFGLGPADGGVLAGAALGLLAVALAAGLVPAIRASRLDPARVLRE